MDEQALAFERQALEQCYNKSWSLTVKETVEPFIMFMPGIAVVLVWTAFHFVNMRGF
jgi:hypothetical protein